MEKAEFSVIIPTKNGFSFLDQTLWHLHEQTFRRFEVCICDDGSTDGTLEKIQIWKNKFEDIGVELKTCVTPALGAGAARNAALNLGKAPLVSFLDSDDFWAPNKLKTVYEIFEKHPNAKVILGHMGENLPFYLWRLDSRYSSTRYSSDISSLPSEVFRRHFFITTSGVCDSAALKCSIETFGPERIMFATDYPYEDIELAGRWMDEAPIDPRTKRMICRETAQMLLRLK